MNHIFVWKKMLRSPLVQISIRTKGDLELQQYEFEPENGIKKLKFFSQCFLRRKQQQDETVGGREAALAAAYF